MKILYLHERRYMNKSWERGLLRAIVRQANIGNCGVGAAGESLYTQQFQNYFTQTSCRTFTIGSANIKPVFSTVCKYRVQINTNKWSSNCVSQIFVVSSEEKLLIYAQRLTRKDKIAYNLLDVTKKETWIICWLFLYPSVWYGIRVLHTFHYQKQKMYPRQ
jgi:hypothetical protein